MTSLVLWAPKPTYTTLDRDFMISLSDDIPLAWMRFLVQPFPTVAKNAQCMSLNCSANVGHHFSIVPSIVSCDTKEFVNYLVFFQYFNYFVAQAFSIMMSWNILKIK